MSQSMNDDLAETTADNLRQAHLAAVNNGEAEVDQAGPMIKESRSGIFAKIRFSWRAQDRMILDQIKRDTQKMFEEQFGSVITILDDFYAKTRDKDGKENWDRLTATDIDGVLFSLEQVKFTLVPQVNELMLDAIYSKHIADDIRDESWLSIIDGTQGDRTAKSNRVSKEYRYHSFFCFAMYSTADSFLKQINAFQRRCEKIQDGRRGYR